MPMKKPKSDKKKGIRHHLKRTKKVVLHKYVLVSLGIISFITIVVVIVGINSTNNIFEDIKNDASSFLAYNRDQILSAGIVGTRKKLESEIGGYKTAPTSLKLFVYKDYKSLKKSCVVNNQLTQQPVYNIKAVVGEEFALVEKGCGSPIKNILIKTDKWSLIFAGNTDIACNLSNDLNIPQPVAMYCSFDGKRYLNPNP
jgi:hypothetical protein